MSKHNKILGKLGEEYVCEFLKKNGYNILKENYKTTYAEIDIIAQKGEIIAFVEVKTRENREFGEPYEAVTKNKQRLIKNAARVYMLNHEDKIASFDVAEVIGVVTRKGLVASDTPSVHNGHELKLDVLDFNYIEEAFC